MDLERRFFSCEIRMSGDETPKIEGYTARFNELSEDLGGFREVIRPGFFAPVVNDDVRGLFNHDPSLILGRNTAGTLEIAEDDAGLFYRIDPPDTQYARDLQVSIRRGDVTQNSFGFMVLEDRWHQATEDRPYVLRELITARGLFDVGPVTFPAYPSTTVNVRAKAREFISDSQATIEAPKMGDVRRLALRRRQFEHKLKYGGF